MLASTIYHMGRLDYIESAVAVIFAIGLAVWLNYEVPRQIARGEKLTVDVHRSDEIPRHNRPGDRYYHCNHCGHFLAADATYCTDCGNEVKPC